MKNETKTNMHALREQAESGGDKVAVCWWYGQSDYVSSWWTAEERQKKARRIQPRWGQRQSRKNKIRPQRGGGFSSNLDCLVLRGDLVCVISQGISRYIVTSCPVSCDITRYGISRHRIISMSRFLGLIWIYRIPSIDFPISNTIFCQLGAPSSVHQESERNGYLAIELQTQWYLLESVPYKNYNY